MKIPKPADWTLPELADENNSLNRGYFENDECDKYPGYYKLKEAIVWISNREKIKTMLEIGCGSGWHATYLKKRGILDGIKYTGFDISHSMCTYAKENFPDGQFIVADILIDDIEERFDVVSESAVLELVKSWENGVRGMMKHSKKWLIFHRLFFQDEETMLEEVPTYNQISDIRWHVGMKELKKILAENNFDIVFSDVWGRNNPYNIGTFVARRK